MDVIESDHKPVRCKFNVEISHVDRSVRRQEFGKIVKSDEKIKRLIEELSYVPETVVSTNKIVLQNQETSTLKICNKSGKDKAIFQISCEGQSTIKEDETSPEYRPRGSFGFPRWLEVTFDVFMLLTNANVYSHRLHLLDNYTGCIPRMYDPPLHPV